MLPKKEKFTTEDFKNKILFKNGRKIYTPCGFFVVLGSLSGKKGIIFSKKSFKTAVLRNKYKRLFYNTLLEIQKQNSELKNKSFVFYPNQPFTKDFLVETFLVSVL